MLSEQNVQDAISAEVAASIAIQCACEWPDHQSRLLRSYIAVAAGQLAAMEGPDHALIVLGNISAALTGGRA